MCQICERVDYTLQEQETLLALIDLEIRCCQIAGDVDEEGIWESIKAKILQ